MNLATTLKAALAGAALAFAGSSFAAHTCSLEAHLQEDQLHLREIAATPITWRDARAARETDPASWVRFKILGINDFHGQLGAGRFVAGRPVGSAPVLAAYLEAEQAQSPNGAIIVHAGDQVGASPPVSALLQDEPSITFLNMIANDYCERSNRLNPRCNIVGTLGNHEFDESVDELLRLIDGGNHPDGPFLQDPYTGANFPYVCANVVDQATGKPILPPFVVKRIGGMPIAFIGAVLKETPTIVTPTGVAGVSFLDEAEAINSYVPVLKKQGVHAIVVTIHQGTRQTLYSGPTDAELGGELDGAIGDIVRNLDDEIDIVVSGHAHGFTNTFMANNNGKSILVTQAFSAGTAYDDIDVAIDPKSRDIVEKSASIVTTWADLDPGFLPPDAQVAELVAQAENAVEPIVNEIIGEAANDILREENDAGESALGNLIADAQRTAMGTDFAFMNPGGIRADLLAGEVTWGDLFTIQPFNNDLVKMDLSGAQIVELLNQQWEGQPFPRILKTSGLTYTWDNNLPEGDRIVEVLNGQGNPLDLAATYTVTVNSFMAAGGDNFTILPQGTNRVIGPVDLDALIDYVQNLPQPFNYAIEGRIQRLN